MSNQQLDIGVLKDYLKDAERWTFEDHKIGLSCAEKMIYHLHRQSRNNQKYYQRIQFLSLVKEYHQQLLQL